MTRPPEVDSERCAELRAELAALDAESSYDELRVKRVFGLRMKLGRERHGPLDISSDTRNYRRERAEEYIDAAVYDACDEIDRADRAAKERP